MAATLCKIVSPKGELRWVTITGEGKENMSGKMQYKVDIIIDPKNNAVDKAFIDKLDKFWADNKPAGFKKKPKSMGYYFADKLLDENGEPQKNEEDEFIYDPNGKVSLSFKTSVTWPDGNTKVVKTRNAKGAIVNLGETQIGNGSIGYVAGAMDIYKQVKGNVTMSAGVTLYLDEVKLTKLVPYAGEDAFAGHEADEEDGWTGEDEDAFTGTEAKVKL